MSSADPASDPFTPLNIADIRKPYALETFEEKNAKDDPMTQFDSWFKEVSLINKIGFEEKNAVCLSTSLSGFPSSRMVLLKKYTPEGFTFYTNSLSRKGREFTENPNVSLLFWWPFVNRQVRIEGTISQVSDEDADEYWHSRPLESQIGSAISEQSSVVPSREFLEEKKAKLADLAAANGGMIQRPAVWKGFIVSPKYFEFWLGHSDRIHDRIAYEKTASTWRRFRLSP